MEKLREVLMIDDDKITCFLHSTVLDNLEVSEVVHCIHDGEEALEYIQECVKRQVYPDLILLDINMPGFDGFDFLKSLRTLSGDEKNKLNVVMLSTTLSHQEIEIAASFGDLLKGYFLKPLDENIVKKILRLIRHNKALPKGKRKSLPSAGNQKQGVTHKTKTI